MKTKNLFLLFTSLLFIFGCSDNEAAKKNNPLIEMKNGVETIWYPGKTQVKYRREYDSKKRRHGKWMLYSPEGKVMSSSFYENGKKTGVWLVNYPNGQLRYTGEFRDDKKFGDWLFYSITGSKILEITYDENGKVVKQKRFKEEDSQKIDTENDTLVEQQKKKKEEKKTTKK